MPPICGIPVAVRAFESINITTRLQSSLKTEKPRLYRQEAEMKPTLELEKPMPATVIIQPDNTDTGRKNPMKRWAVGIVLGLVAAIVITAIVLVALHFGVKVTHDNYKEALVTFNGVRGDEKVTEKITVTENEEDVEVPRKFRIIYDYDKGLAVMQFTNVKDETDGVCYVTRFNVTSGDNIDKVRDEMKSDVMERTVTSDPGEQSYESSGEAADRGLLSPRASEMCRDHPVYWARESTETGGSTGRRRRAARCFFRYYLYCRWYGCWVIRVTYCYR